LIAKWHVHRRTFLKGLGAAVALPMLDAMVPSLASVTSAAAANGAGMPKRMAFIYVPNGVTLPHWTPNEVGADYALPRILKPLAEHKDDFSILSGFAQSQGLALGDGAGDHARASASFLTGCHARKTSGADIRAGVSVDQLAAGKIGRDTVLPSLELSCDLGRRVGACDSGYSCAYQFNLSWHSETMPVMPETDPKAVFERLFGDVSGGVDSAKARSRRAMFHRSILDFVADDAKNLQRRLGAGDQRKLDEYLTAVREIERRVEIAEKSSPRLPDGTRAPEMFNTFEEHVRLMLDMLVLAFQTDSTRVGTFIVSHEGSNRPYGEIGVNDGHHDLSHHFGDPKNIEKITRINEFHARQLAYLLARMKSVKESDGSNLLDNSMIVYGSGLGDGNAHNHDNLPILLAGRGGGTITPGRHLKVDKGTPLNNVFVSMLDRVGVEVDHFGDSTGRYDAIG
jgi:hypothetical protein